MSSLRSPKLLTAVAFIIAGPLAVAQGTGKKEQAIEMSAEARSAVVRRAFQNDLQGTLDKYLKPHQYNVQVQFDLNQGSKAGEDVPYAPDNIVSDAFQGLPSGKQLDQIKDLKIQVQVPKWVDEGTKQTLRAMAEKSLSEKTGRPIKVGIESVALDVEEPKKSPALSPEPRPAAPAAAVSGGALGAGQGLSQGGAAASQADLTRAMNEIAELKKKVDDTRSVDAKADRNGNGNSLESAGSSSSGHSWISDLVNIGKQYPIATLAALSILYLLLAIIILIPSRSLVSGFKQIGTAFDALSRALKGMGDAMGARRAEAAEDDAGNEDTETEATIPVEAAVATTKPVRDHSQEELNEKIQTIRMSHKQDYDRIVIDLVLNYLHDPEKSYWAVFLLDIVGRDHARRVFESLDAADQEELMRLVKHSIPEDRIDANIELVEAYQMRLLTFGWKGGGKSRSLDPDIQRIVSQLAFEDIAPILNRLGETGIRRFMLYLDSKTMGQLIRSVRRNPQSQRFLIQLLARMPEAIHESMVDTDISTQIKAHFQKKQDDLYLPYLTQYEEIVGQVGDDLEDDMIEQLGAANSEIGSYLKRKLVTMGTFFALPVDEQRDLLTTFTNNDYALLVSSLHDEAQKAVILKLLDGSRKELVTEQLSILQEESKIILADRHKDIRRRLRTLLKQLRSTNSSAEFGDKEGTSITPRDVA